MIDSSLYQKVDKEIDIVVGKKKITLVRVSGTAGNRVHCSGRVWHRPCACARASVHGRVLASAV